MYVRKKHNRSGTTSVVTINFLKLARTLKLSSVKKRSQRTANGMVLKATSPIPIWMQSLSLTSTVVCGLLNVHSEFQKELWICVLCFTLRKEELRHTYASASSHIKYIRNWSD